MANHLAILGAGILGRLLALQFLERKWQVSLFDERIASGQGSCSYTAAGMLCPGVERDTAEAAITQLGIASLERWPSILKQIHSNAFFKRIGTLVVAHSEDQDQYTRFRDQMILQGQQQHIEEIDRAKLLKLEPHFDEKFQRAIFFPLEGQIDNREILEDLAQQLVAHANCHFNEQVLEVAPQKVVTPRGTWNFDLIVDCRGLGAQDKLKGLRGVRGEILTVECKEVQLLRPIRLLHPRHSVYVVPRRDHRYLIGATHIESESDHPVTVRSALELLSSAFVLHSAFAEAQILETAVQIRPAFGDNLPHVKKLDDIIYINGLYRHGYLVAPELSYLVAEWIEQGDWPDHLTDILEEPSTCSF